VQLHHSDKVNLALSYERRVGVAIIFMSQDMQQQKTRQKVMDSGAKRIDEASPA
jgi:hypothetical protein